MPADCADVPTAVHSATRNGFRSGGNVRSTSAMPEGPSMAPPTPAAARHATSAGSDGARPLQSCAAARTAMPAYQSRRWPTTSPRRPAPELSAQVTRLCARLTQSTDDSDASRSSAIFGMTMMMTLLVAFSRKDDAATTAKRSQRRPTDGNAASPSSAPARLSSALAASRARASTQGSSAASSAAVDDLGAVVRAVLVLALGDELLDLVGAPVSAVLGVVEARGLDLRGDAELAHGGERAEEEGHRRADPRHDDADAGEGGHEGARRLAAVEDARAVVLALAVVRHRVVVGRGEEGGGDDAPHAAGAVDGEGVDRVVDARLLDRGGRGDVDRARERADDDGARGRDDGAGRRDADEAREDAVVDVARVDVVEPDVADQGRREAAGRGAERRRDGDVGGGLGVAVDVERRAAVEAVPAHPEDEDAERLVDGLALGEIVGEALAGAHELGGDDGGDAAGHVDRARAREVDDAAAADEAARGRVVGVVVVGAARERAPGGEAAGAPHHVDDGRVDEAREDDGVDGVGRERRALRDRAGDDRAARAREVQPKNQEAKRPRGARVEDVLDEDVLGVLLGDGA
ncbi:putative ammonium transporter, partial [Aureococcus anophagefferens]